MIAPALFALAAAGLVESDSGCPAAAQIQAKLGALVGSGARPAGRISVQTEPSGLRLALRDGGGALLSERTVAAGADCAERASTAAVVIAAWMAEVPVESLPSPELPAAVLAVAPPAPPASPLSLELAAGALAALSGGARFGGRLDVELGRAGGRLAGRLELNAPAGDTLEVADGLVRWRRTSFALAAVVRPLDGSLRLALDAGLLATVLGAEGTGFEEDDSDVAWSVGVAGGLRAAVALGPVRLYLDGRALHWPGSQRVRVRQLPDARFATETLGTTELQVGAGLSVPLF